MCIFLCCMTSDRDITSKPSELNIFTYLAHSVKLSTSCFTHPHAFMLIWSSAPVKISKPLPNLCSIVSLTNRPHIVSLHWLSLEKAEKNISRHRQPIKLKVSRWGWDCGKGGANLHVERRSHTNEVSALIRA